LVTLIEFMCNHKGEDPCTTQVAAQIAQILNSQMITCPYFYPHLVPLYRM